MNKNSANRILILVGIMGVILFLLYMRGRQEQLRVMSFNILRPEWGREGFPSWEQRKKGVCDVLAEYKPDLLGIQEETQAQLDDLLASDPGLRLAGQRPGGGGSILYRHDKYVLEKSGAFPVPESMVHGGQRSVQWGLFHPVKGRKRILYFNLHLTPFDEVARVKGVEIILEHIKAFTEPFDAVILTGDFNTLESELPVQYFFADPTFHFRSAWREAHGFRDQLKTSALVGAAKAEGKRRAEILKTGGQLSDEEEKKMDAIINASGQGTFHGYAPKFRPGQIDYIMVPQGMEVLHSEIITKPYHGVLPSDHFPVWADLSFN